MEDYKARLARLDLLDSSEVINNTSIEHASLMIARMIARARTSVKIFTGSLNPAVYADEAVLRAFGTFLLGREGNAQILVHSDGIKVTDDAIIGELSPLGKLAETFGYDLYARIKVRRLSSQLQNSVSANFIVVDRKSFRFQRDIAKHDAVGSFNQPEIAEKLEPIFDDMFIRSDVIDLRVPA